MKNFSFDFEKNGSGIIYVLFVSIICLSFSTELQAQAPTSVTEPASSISLNSAIVHGTVNANNSETTVTFEYGINTAYGGIFEADQSPVSGSADTPVSVTIYELEPNTVYHYRVMAVNSSDTIYGDDLTFTTMDLPPTAETNAATIDLNNATLNGMVFGRGYDTDVTFEFGLDTNYGTIYTAEESPLLNLFSTINYPVTKSLIGLADNMTYHYRVVASNENGISYGSDEIFTIGTVGSAPTAVTNAASEIGVGDATLNGTVNANNSETAVTFDYGLDEAYGNSFEADQSPVSGSEDTAVSLNIYELEANSTYHYRIVAINANDTTYGTDQTFTTNAVPPVAVTNSASGITAATATLNGTVNPNDASTTITFEYGTNTGYGTTVTADQSPATGNSDLAVSKTISGLIDGVTYHYRVVATNSGGTTQGMDMTFVVGTILPTVITDAVSDVGTTTATLNGTINANSTKYNSFI